MGAGIGFHVEYGEVFLIGIGFGGIKQDRYKL